MLPPGGLLPPGGAFSGGLPSGGWECFLQGGPSSQGVLPPRGGLLRGWWRPPGTATAAGATHPTGMHSCSLLLFMIVLG